MTKGIVGFVYKLVVAKLSIRPRNDGSEGHRDDHDDRPFFDFLLELQ